jgi:2,3-bisphosphoglycerate-dependent phosphoglycerate mutase
MNLPRGSDQKSVSNDFAQWNVADDKLAGVYSWDFLIRDLNAGLTGPPIELHLVRHAETVANARHVIAGQSEVELSVRGYLQAFLLAFRLGPEYDIAWVSSLRRSHQTLELVDRFRLHRLSKLPICSDPRLNERSMGDLEGTPRRRIGAYAVGDLSYAPEQGESYLDLARRVLSFLVDLRRNVQGREMKVLVSTHAGPMRLLVGIIERFDNAKAVLALNFSNAQSYRCMLTNLYWPAFIQRGVLFERDRQGMETAKRTPDNSQV